MSHELHTAHEIVIMFCGERCCLKRRFKSWYSVSFTCEVLYTSLFHLPLVFHYYSTLIVHFVHFYFNTVKKLNLYTLTCSILCPVRLEFSVVIRHFCQFILKHMIILYKRVIIYCNTVLWFDKNNSVLSFFVKLKHLCTCIFRLFFLLLFIFFSRS